MFRFLASFIKTTIITSLFFLASYANAEILYQSAASALVDENGHAEIPSNYTEIGSYAFQNNYDLKTITIPDTITKIRHGAFYSSGIESVAIPDSVTYIESQTFYNASQLQVVHLGDGITSIPSEMFYNTGLREITIPDNVTTIYHGAFQETPLRNVTFGNSLNTIGQYAFFGTNLTTLNLPDSVSTINHSAFKDLPLQELILGASLDNIDSSNFGNGSDCNTLTTVTSKMANIPYQLFYNCFALKNVTLENTVSIGSQAFQNTAIESITFPETTVEINSNAFNGSALNEVIFNDSLIEIEEYAFRNNNLTEVTLPDSLEKIGNSAFDNNSLSQITIPNYVRTVGSHAFDNNPLKEVTTGEAALISKGSSYQNRGVFGCDVEKITYREPVIEHYFSQCSENEKPTNIIIENSVNEIGQYAFQLFSSLTKITIPEGVTIIRNRAFEGSGLREIILPAGLSLFEGYAFQNTEISEVIIPSTVTSMGSYAFENTNLSKVTIIEPADAYINYDAFGSDNFIEYNFCSNIDTDLDGTVDCLDAFPMDGSESQDADLDGIGNNLDTDDDNDGYNDTLDAFPNDANEWVDTDLDGIGNNSDNDDDNDGAVDSEDAFPLDETQIYDITGDILQVDSDHDGILDVFDPNPNYNPNEYCDHVTYDERNFDTDNDGVNNCNDGDDDNDGLLDIYEPFYGTNPLIPDSDFDGVLDGLDAFPTDNTESLDTDTDGIGNNADTDDDNDGHFDLLDVFPLDANDWMDSDLDGIGNNADLDDDNDGVADAEDAFPYTASESVDTDGDGYGDNSDAFPSDSTEWADSDLDGIGNNADTDDDNDGIADADDSDPLNDSIGDLPSQNLFVMGSPVAVNGHITTISIGYDVTDTNNQLNGIGFRIHYDSNIYGYSESQNSLNESLVVDGMGPYQDTENFDKDDTTDSYIVFGWAAVNADWPNTELLAKLTDIKLFVNWADYEQGPTTSNINFSNIDNAEGYDFEATNYVITVLPATWDFDGNGLADALTDGLMLLRYTFGIRDISMALGAMAENATVSATQVVENMHRAIIVADIDGNGSTDALTDGLILLRYLFGLRGENLITGSISSNATRTTHEQIEQYIETYMP